MVTAESVFWVGCIVVLASLVVVAVVGSRQAIDGFQRMEAGSADGADGVEFRGALRARYRYASTPMASMRVGPDRLIFRFRGTGPVGGYAIERASVDAVVIRRAMAGCSVRVVGNRGGTDGLTFWSFAGAELRQALVTMGWPVNP